MPRRDDISSVFAPVDPLLVERFARSEGCMSNRQLARELEARNVLAERIAAVLRQRQKIGAERRTHKSEYQRLNHDRALARYYRLGCEAVAQPVDGITVHSESVPRAVSDVRSNKVAKRGVQPYVPYLRWNSVNGSSV